MRLSSQTSKYFEERSVVMNFKEDKTFPGGPVTKNLPSNAGDNGLIPGRGTKIPQAAGQLSPNVAITEPVL